MQIKVKVLQEGKKIRIDGGRLSFPSLFTPVSYKNEATAPAKYNATVLLPKECEEAIATIEAQVKKAIETMFDTPAAQKKALANMRNQPNYRILKDGDEKEDRDGYPEHWYIHASNVRAPMVMNQKRVRIMEDDGSIQAGDYVSIIIDFYKSKNYGIVCASLSAVQKMKTGDRFSSSAANASDFDDVAVEDDDNEATGTDGEAYF